MKRKLLLFMLSMTACVDMMAIEEVAAPMNVYARDVLSLNGKWNYIIDQQDIGYYDYPDHTQRNLLNLHHHPDRTQRYFLIQ